MSVVLFRRDDDVSISKPTTTVSEQDASRVIVGITNDWAGGKDRVSLVDTYVALPESIKREAKRQDAENAIKGVFHDGQIHIVLDQHSSTFFVLKTNFWNAVVIYGVIRYNTAWKKSGSEP